MGRKEEGSSCLCGAARERERAVWAGTIKELQRRASSALACSVCTAVRVRVMVRVMVRDRVRVRVRFSFRSFEFSFTEYIHTASFSMWCV